MLYVPLNYVIVWMCHVVILNYAEIKDIRREGKKLVGKLVGILTMHHTFNLSCPPCHEEMGLGESQQFSPSAVMCFSNSDRYSCACRYGACSYN